MTSEQRSFNVLPTLSFELFIYLYAVSVYIPYTERHDITTEQRSFRAGKSNVSNVINISIGYTVWYTVYTTWWNLYEWFAHRGGYDDTL